MGGCSIDRHPLVTDLEGFTCRAYGILIEAESVLITRERVEGMELVKFPGGGIEVGEGPGETLRREFLEETGLDIRVGRVVHVSTEMVESRFAPKQVIAIYWRVEKVGGTLGVPVGEHTVEEVRFCSVDSLPVDEMFPTDREVARLLREERRLQGGDGRR